LRRTNRARALRCHFTTTELSKNAGPGTPYSRGIPLRCQFDRGQAPRRREPIPCRTATRVSLVLSGIPQYSDPRVPCQMPPFPETPQTGRPTPPGFPNPKTRKSLRRFSLSVFCTPPGLGRLSVVPRGRHTGVRKRIISANPPPTSHWKQPATFSLEVAVELVRHAALSAWAVCGIEGRWFWMRVFRNYPWAGNESVRALPRAAARIGQAVCDRSVAI